LRHVGYQERKSAVCGSAEGTVLWSVATPSKVLTYPQHAGALWAAFDGNGKHLLTFNPWISQLRLWDTGTGQRLLESPTFNIPACDLAPDGDLLLLRPNNGKLELWEVEPGHECESLATGLHSDVGGPISIAISPDGRLLAVGGVRGFELWDLQTQHRVPPAHR